MIPLWFMVAYTAFRRLRHGGLVEELRLDNFCGSRTSPSSARCRRCGSGVRRSRACSRSRSCLPEILWNVDFVGRLVLRRRITGLTDYMFEPERPRLLRGLSLFHVPLPLVLLWFSRLMATTAASVCRAPWRSGPLVLPFSRLVRAPDKNITDLRARRSPVALAAWAYVLALFCGSWRSCSSRRTCS